MDNATLEQFRQEMVVLMEDTLSQAEFSALYKKYGFSGEELEIPVVINVDKINKINNTQELSTSSVSQTFIGEEITLLVCCIMNGQLCCKPKSYC
ncbi:hypothetical protein [Mastigocoleus sp. MO_188.B34]|uniref:hypothetical protein n=1 Tax=Mastigocoleus sp. MO_188.B34 TaxID=3036635 RepID=UPI0026027BAC|nr:hypothetical protein [Mastigocoleus sp. MO_188.B34]MDJ0693064.1 hypothetical protein [Mastigocoleus sp. MO_188.B34]